MIVPGSPISSSLFLNKKIFGKKPFFLGKRQLFFGVFFWHWLLAGRRHYVTVWVLQRQHKRIYINSFCLILRSGRHYNHHSSWGVPQKSPFLPIFSIIGLLYCSFSNFKKLFWMKENFFLKPDTSLLKLKRKCKDFPPFFKKNDLSVHVFSSYSVTDLTLYLFKHTKCKTKEVLINIEHAVCTVAYCVM